MPSLEERWNSLAIKVGCPQTASLSWWKKIHTLYSEKQRYYHTLTHIEALFAFFDQTQSFLNRPQLVALAIFFHDIIYQPKESTNEEESALLFNVFADDTTSLTTEDKNIVYQWIIDTKEHKGIIGKECDLNYFLDMDLSILGTERSTYAQYADNIRQEYIHYPDEAFFKGRAAVLKTFIPKQDETIFKTSYFISQYEEQAINNLKWEIEYLLEKASELEEEKEV